jgi:hypothetical protein
MRYWEILGEATAGERAWKATRRKNRAMADYQAALRANAETAPPDRRAERDAKAKRTLQSKMGAADDALRSALRSD